MIWKEEGNILELPFKPRFGWAKMASSHGPRKRFAT